MYDKMLKIFLIISFLSGMSSCEKKIEPKSGDLNPEILSFSPASGTEQTKVTFTGNNFPIQSQYNLIILEGFNIVPSSSELNTPDLINLSGGTSSNYS